jgi:hypothetical protein
MDIRDLFAQTPANTSAHSSRISGQTSRSSGRRRGDLLPENVADGLDHVVHGERLADELRFLNERLVLRVR